MQYGREGSEADGEGGFVGGCGSDWREERVAAAGSLASAAARG